MMPTQAFVEGASLRDLTTLVKSSDDANITMVVIGGYAVRAYTQGYRYTKDIDVAIEQLKMGPFIGLLKSLKYATRKTDFGLGASKKVDNDSVEVHISAGKIPDISSGVTFLLDREFFKSSVMMAINAKFEENKPDNAQALVAELNALVVLKLIPQGRPEKDGVDLVSLFLDRPEDLDPTRIAAIAKRCAVENHVLSQARQFAEMLRGQDMQRAWGSATSTRLTSGQVVALQRMIRNIVEAIRSK